MAGQGVTLECAACGNRWTVLPKLDGTMPVGARCPKSQGGCGKVRKIPRSPNPAAVTVAAAAVVWDPPSQPRDARQASGECPECGGPVMTEPRGITRWCPACPLMVTPPGVLAPYERGTATARAAKSQRERDDDAKKTVLAAGEFLRRVGALLDDPKIHPASADLLGWYQEEITDARKGRDGRRLAELAREFADDDDAGAFRRLHFWQGRPAAITAVPNDEDDEDEGFDEDEDGQDDEPAALVLATPASIAAQQQRAQPQRMTWAEALAVCGWRLTPTHGGCQVIDVHGQHCAGPIGSPGIQMPDGRHVWMCTPHYGALGGVIIETNRTRGVA